LQYSIPNHNLVGLTLPGFPFILIGRNEKISWGITNLMSDDFDLFLEKNKGNDYYYKSETLVEKYTYIKDSIVIKNKETSFF
jgi:penicillin amidase